MQNMPHKAAVFPAAIAPADRSAARLDALLLYGKALSIYLCSRLVVFLGVVLGKIYIPLGHDIWLGGERWYHRLLRWDSEWYQIIASQGYRYNGDPGEAQTVVFYPLYPALSRAVSEILRIDLTDSMLLVANLAALAAVILLFKLVRERFDDSTALGTVAMISFFPASVFLSAGYTEPLALMLVVAFFLALVRERFLAAAVIAGLASATRAAGIVLCPVLLFELWRCRPPRRFLIEAVPLSLVAVSGLGLYIVYLGIAFHHPMAFAQGQTAFHENTALSSRLISALTLQPFRRFDLTDLSPAGLDRWFTLLFVALIIYGWFAGIGRGMMLLAALLLALPYLTLSGGPSGFTSMARFNIVSFPLFIAMARLVLRWPWAVPSIAGLFGGLLLIYAALFSQWQWVG